MNHQSRFIAVLKASPASQCPFRPSHTHSPPYLDQTLLSHSVPASRHTFAVSDTRQPKTYCTFVPCSSSSSGTPQPLLSHSDEAGQPSSSCAREEPQGQQPYTPHADPEVRAAASGGHSASSLQVKMGSLDGKRPLEGGLFASSLQVKLGSFGGMQPLEGGLLSEKFVDESDGSDGHRRYTAMGEDQEVEEVSVQEETEPRKVSGCSSVCIHTNQKIEALAFGVIIHPCRLVFYTCECFSCACAGASGCICFG